MKDEQDRKARGDSVLKNLPAERQDSIFEHGETHTLAKTVKWLAADGLEVSPDQVSKFLSWRRLRRRLSLNASAVKTLMEDYKKENPAATERELQQMGQMFFSAMALEEQDPKQWFFIQKLALQKQQLAFERDKFEFDAAKAALKFAAELKVISANKTLSEADKVNAARAKLFGGDLPK